MSAPWRWGAYREFAEFIASSPRLEEIIEFRFSDETYGRISTLLMANRTGTLDAEGRSELDDFLCLQHFVQMVKLRAFDNLNQT
jgi:hypothetical protein